MKIIACMAIISAMLVSACASADYDVQNMQNDELYELRISINEELGRRSREQALISEGTPITELFPDEWVARYIRDKLGKFSTQDSVTQDELDTIDRFYVDGQTSEKIQITTLEGIQYLRNLKELTVNKQENITEIPEWVGSLICLEELVFRYCPIKTVPDCVCNLTGLETLSFFGSEIESLPADIGNLSELESLDISYTSVSDMPASIYNLELSTFRREGLDID